MTLTEVEFIVQPRRYIDTDLTYSMVLAQLNGEEYVITLIYDGETWKIANHLNGHGGHLTLNTYEKKKLLDELLNHPKLRLVFLLS